MRSLGHAAGSVDEHGTGQEHPPSTSLQDLIKQALRARSNIMFSGKTGAAVASGIKDDAATAEKPTYGLARAAIDVVFKELRCHMRCQLSLGSLLRSLTLSGAW